MKYIDIKILPQLWKWLYFGLDLDFGLSLSLLVNTSLLDPQYKRVKSSSVSTVRIILKPSLHSVPWSAPWYPSWSCPYRPHWSPPFSPFQSLLTLKTRKISWVVWTDCAQLWPHTVSLPELARFRAGLHYLPDRRCANESPGSNMHRLRQANLVWWNVNTALKSMETHSKQTE